MTREEARNLIEQTGVFPGIRVNSADQALYCAEVLFRLRNPSRRNHDDSAQCHRDHSSDRAEASRYGRRRRNRAR